MTDDPGSRTRVHSRLRTVTGDDSAAMQKRLRILHQAKIAFFAHGYESANLQEIAEAAGVSKVTIYQFFIDKADLFKQVMIDVANYISDPLRVLLLKEGNVRETLIDFASTYTRRLLETVTEGHRYLEILRLILPLTVSNREVSWICRDIFRESIHRPLVEYFSRLIEAGVLRSEEPDYLALHFTQLAFLSEVAVFELSKINRDGRIEENAARIVSIFLDGVLAD